MPPIPALKDYLALEVLFLPITFDLTDSHDPAQTPCLLDLDKSHTPASQPKQKFPPEYFELPLALGIEVRVELLDKNF